MTVSFGEFAEFECHANSTHQIELELFIGTSEDGSAQIYPHQRSDLRAIEIIFANVTMNSARNISIGKAVIVMNSHTLQLVEYFFCKAFGDIWISKSSIKAYLMQHCISRVHLFSGSESISTFSKRTRYITSICTAYFIKNLL